MSHEKTDLNEWLDEYTIRKHSESWQAGGGVRFFDAGGRRSGRGPAFEIRTRLGLGGGNLPGTTLAGRVSAWPSSYSYEFVSKESYSFNEWNFTALFQANVFPTAGFFLGPGLQSFTINADRDWTGPDGCSTCGDATDKTTERYGQLELGARWRPGKWPLSLEGYGVPFRVPLSTTHILQSENWTTANFPSFKRTLGARLVYEF